MRPILGSRYESRLRYGPFVDAAGLAVLSVRALSVHRPRISDRDHESDPEAIRKASPESSHPDGSNTVLYEFISMPDSAGFNRSNICVTRVTSQRCGATARTADRPFDLFSYLGLRGCPPRYDGGMRLVRAASSGQRFPQLIAAVEVYYS